MNKNRAHHLIVKECYTALKYADDPTPILRRYGKKTRNEAMEMLKNDYEEKYGEKIEF